MIAHLRGWVAGLAGLALGLGLLSAGPGSAADDKTLPDGVQKVAAALEKKDTAGAKKLAEEIAKKAQMDDIMHLYALRTKKGLGVGSKAGAISPDGIERKLMDLAKKKLDDKALGDESPALTEMGYSMAALALIAGSKPPDKDEGKKKKKDWVSWSDELQKQAIEFASAAKDKKAAELHKAAKGADATCTKCHDVFRE